MHLYLKILLLFLLNTSLANANLFQVSGSVHGDDQIGLAFVNIQFSEQSHNTTTNSKGQFTVNLSQGPQQITVSHIGYKTITQIYQINSDTNLVIKMEPTTVYLDNVIVSTSRSSKTTEQASVPLTIISQNEIKTSGSIRLNELLEEQTGLQIVEDAGHGTGIQLQGLSSDYIQILIDGQPIIGRTAGILDLKRLLINDVERIEIIKGPASSLYGSESLAGVINIIRKKQQPGWDSEVAFKYRSYNTLDLNVNGGFKREKFNLKSSFNRLSSEGYDLQPENIALSAPEFSNYSASISMGYWINTRSQLSISGNYFNETQLNKDALIDSEVLKLRAEQLNGDATISYKYWLEKGHKLEFINRLSVFRNDNYVNIERNDSLYSFTDFKQLLNTTFAQLDLVLKENITIVSGVGFDFENVFSSRYHNETAFLRGYLFSQLDWKLQEKLFLSAGFRFDAHSIYNEQFSPKISIKYQPVKWLGIKASVGNGYKAPDFRQLVLNFTNSTEGYSVFGNYLAKETIEQLENDGLISNVDRSRTIEPLKNEQSWAFNASITLQPHDKLTIENNWFRNQVTNLIDALPIATNNGGQNVFTYFNINQVITQGLETKIQFRPIDGLNISAGYQYLRTKDLEAVEKYNNEEIIGRTAENSQRRYTLDEYGGLYNRSKHTANIKATYTNEKHDFSISIRNLYRGKFGFGDVNNSGYLDDEREYVDGYYNLDITLQKEFLSLFNILFSIDNITNSTNEFLPSMPGRIYTIGLSLHLNKDYFTNKNSKL